MKKILEKKYIIIGIVLMLIILLIAYISLTGDHAKAEEVDKTIQEPIEEEKEECFVNIDIKGYVNNPGLYQLECDKRVVDVINMAGGLKKNADTSVINLGKKVFDQMVIIIYSNDEVKKFAQIKEEEKQKIEKCVNNIIVKNDACVESNNLINNDKEIVENNADNNIIEKSKKVSLNNATKEELMSLTGIGESKALDIISYRTENNGFKSIEEIMNISGIGEKAYEKIKDSLTL